MKLPARIFGIAAAVLAVCATTALAGSGVGGVFNLGQTNTVNGATTLSGSSAGAQLKVTNAFASGTGIWGQSASKTAAGVQGMNTAGGPGLQSTVSSNAIPPLKINSSAKVVSLNADRLDGFDSTVFSRRQIPANEEMHNLSSAGDVGKYTSATIGEDGLGLISYYDATHNRLMVAHCANLACTSAKSSPIDTGGGEYTSIAIGADGFGVISYVDSSSLVLKVAHCSNIACTSATKTTLDSVNAGGYTSIAISGDGYGLVSYYSTQGGGSLKVAHCANVLCAGGNTYTVDSGGGVSTKGLYTSITSIGSGLGLISYYDLTNGNLKTAFCTTFSCSSSVTTTVDNSADDVGRWASITRGADGLGLISYQDATTGQIEVAHCLSEQCTAITTKGLGPGTEDSIAVGADGLPMLTYYYSGGLAIYHCADANCSNVSGYTVGSTGQFGQYSGITIGTDGFPLISFYDAVNGDLWALHCSNPYCTRYFRRR